jgi:hypothetical protein
MAGHGSGSCEEVSMLTSTRDRVAAATGALFVVLVTVGNQIDVGGTDQSAHPTGASVLHDAAGAYNAGHTIGFVLEITGFLVLFGFLGYLIDAGRRAGGGRGGTATAVAALAGLTTLIVKISSVAPIATVAMDHASISPELARVLNDINGVGFVLAWLPWAVLVGAAALGLFQGALVGRPTLITGLVLGLAGLVLGILGLRDPVDANALAWMAGLLWTLVVSVRLAVRPGVRARGALDEPAGAPVPAAA